MKKQFFLLTAFGKDRPGMVAGVTQIIFDLGGNIEDASMTRLGGEFTMMLVTALPAGTAVKDLQKKLSSLEKTLGLALIAKAISPALASSARQIQPKYLISVYGTDRPGIVYHVTQALAKRKLSVTDLQTKIADRGGKPLYIMLLEVQSSAALDVDALREDLDTLRHDLGVEISLQDIEAIAL